MLLDTNLLSIFIPYCAAYLDHHNTIDRNHDNFIVEKHRAELRHIHVVIVFSPVEILRTSSPIVYNQAENTREY